MKTDTKEKILKYIVINKPVLINDLVKYFGFSNQIIHRHIKSLVDENKIYKVGTPPKVYYFPFIESKTKAIKIDYNDNKFLLDNFIEFTPDWKMLYWIDWFDYWCQKRWLDTKKEMQIYKNTLDKYNGLKNKFWLIDGIQKMRNIFDKVYLDEIYYIDFYSIEKYWKTLLWNLVFYGKQNPDKEIISKIIDFIKLPIFNLIVNWNIEGFAFIPPSIKRKVQILDEIKKWLNIKLDELKLLKIFKDKIVSQKSLSKKEDRIINAQDTIFIWNREFSSNKILLIDDAVWSWATLNETAKKIKETWVSKYVVWIAIVWSYKGFEVINEI